jgi:translation initiation factor 1
MNKKSRNGIVYSTNPDFHYEQEGPVRETLPAAQQQLYVWIDSKGRKGKTVSLVRGFKGADKDLEVLARELKALCCTGGSVKNGEIIIQGDFREKILLFLSGKGYKVKKAGG